MMDSVLIVEDHDRLREQLGRFYAEEGYKVVTAACGEEAIEKLTKEKFAIVVSDVKMPGIDGFQLARHVREKYPDTDIILITAFGNIKQAVEAMKLGASDYITKPFQPEAIRLYLSSGYEPVAGFGYYKDAPLSRCFAKRLG